MIGIGTDIVDLDRLVDAKESFVKHVLSNEEINQYNQYQGQRKVEYLGGRFAGKEAIIKAISSIEIPSMNEISIINEESGKPIASFKNYKISISISHEKKYAIAFAIVE